MISTFALTWADKVTLPGGSPQFVLLRRKLRAEALKTIGELKGESPHWSSRRRRGKADSGPGRAWA